MFNQQFKPLTGNFQNMIGKPQQQPTKGQMSPMTSPIQKPGQQQVAGVRQLSPQTQQVQQPFGTYTGPGGVQQGIADPNQGFAQYMAQNPALGGGQGNTPQQQKQPLSPTQFYQGQQQQPPMPAQPQLSPQQGMFGPKPFVSSGLMPGVPSLYQAPGTQQQPQPYMPSDQDVMNDDSAFNRNSMMTPQQPQGGLNYNPQNKFFGSQTQYPQQQSGVPGVQQSFNTLFGQPSFQTNGYMRY